MPRNDPALSTHECPDIRIHTSDIFQPPGIGISPIFDMEAQQAIVNAVPATNSRAEIPRNPRCDLGASTS
jgi:hypothetical protein